MAEKKSWRDYSKTYSGNKSTDNSADEEKTGSWRDYSKYYSTDNAPKSSWRDYATTDTGSIVGSNVVNRVNNWLQNHSTYISDYQKRFSGRKGGYEDAYVSDSGSWMDTVSKQTDEYETERQNILSYMDQHKDYLDADWVEKIRNTLAKGRDAQFKIRDAAKKDNEYWARFTPNEEQTAAGYTPEKLYNEWQTGQKQYAEDQAYDVEAGLLELEELKKERDAYLAEQEEKRKQAQEDESFLDSLGRWLGNTPDTTIPLAGANDPISSERHTNEYDKRIAELEERIERSKYVQGYEGYMANMDAEDYAANSQYVSTRTDVAMDDARWGFGNTMYDESKLFGDFLYDYINGNQDALDVATVNDTASDAYLLGFDKGFLKTLSKDEIGVYNSLYKLDKEQGTEKATEFLRFIESDLKGRKRAQEQAFWAGYAKEDPVGSSVFSTLISPLKGISYLGQAADMLDDGKMDENAGYNRFSYIPSTIRSQVSTTIENSGKWGKVGSFAYNTGMSMADFLFTTAVSGGNQSLSLAIMGSGAAADATIAAKDRGLDDGQAFALGTIAGLAEVAMEKISLGAWLEGDMTEGALRYVLKNALAEGGEEAGTSAINLLADVMISGDKSEWNVAMQAYIDQGKSPQEAFGLVAAEQAAQIGLDALGGMLSGAAIGGGTYAGTSAVAGFQYGDTAKNKVESQKLVAEGLELNPNSQYVQKAKSKLDKGNNLTGMQVRNILAANQEQITTNDIKKIQQAAVQRLTDLGQTENVAEVAEIATKWATGQEITRAEKKLLTHSEYGSRVANELLPDNIASGDYSTEWAEEIGTKQVNAKQYNKKGIEMVQAIVEQMKNMEDPNAYKSLESRVDTETPAKVSDTGKAVIRATGEEIDLTSPTFKQITEDGVVLDVNGKQVRSNEIEYDSEDQGLAINAIGKIEHITPAVASSLYAKLDMKKPVMKQLNGMDEAFTYGYYNYSEADLEAGTFTGDLTKDQLNDAYNLGRYVRKNDTDAKADAFKQMRTAADAVAEKNATEGKAAPGAKNLTLTYNKGNGEVVSIDEAKLNDQQSGGVEWAKVLHKMGLGTRVEFFESYESETMTVKDKKTGKVKKARVFINDAGVEQIAYSGVYRKRDGTIRIDLNAYNGRGFTLNALAHELTHFIQQWSDKKYKVLVDFLMKEYEKTDMTMHERVLREQKRLENIRGEEVSYDEAYDEVVANAMNKMFDDGKMAEKLAKLKEQDKNLAQKLWEGFKEILAKFIGIYEKEGLFQDADVLVEMKETFEQLQNMFAEALVEASDNYQASLTMSESQSITEAGIGFDEDTKSVYSLHFSTAYKDEIQVGKKTFDTEAIAKIVAKGTGRSIEDARKWVQSEMTIANIVMANPEFLDFEADSRYEAIKKNSDYPQGTVDLSNLCPKREEFTTMFDMLQKKYPNKLFTAQDVAEMRKILSDNDITVACGACFVEDRRQLLGEIADTYINMWKEAVETGKPLQKTNAAGVKSDLLVTKALAKQYGLTAGTKIMATDTYIPNQYDLTTYEGFKLLEKNHPTIAMGFNRYNNSRGQQSARLIEGRAEYKRQILGWSDAKVRSVNNNGGLRIFSFSDFEVVHLLDLVQVIIDCAAKGVKIQGYTKIPAFAKLVRDTGIKLNRSLIPKGDYGYHMENGKVVLDYDTTEGIDINDKNFIDESANPNVGNIVIGINPTQIGAAMLDPFVDYIIPFHSNKAKEILKKLGTGEWVNYKESQHEKDISTGTSSKHNVNIYTEVLGKYHPTNKVEFVEAFLKECKRQGKIPRYAEFLNVDANGDYAYREGYQKLLVDFKMFDADGNILPQGNITPKLNEGFMTELLNAEVDKKQNYEFPQKVYDAIDKQFGEQYSEHDVDTDEITDYDGGKKETKQEDKANVTRKETRESFHRRAHEKAFTVRERGQIALGYAPVTDKTERAGRTEENLKKLGIQVIVHEGLEVNVNGITRAIPGDATSVAGDVVYVRNSMETDPMETAGHEAYHFWKRTDARLTYEEIVTDNIDFASDAFVEFQKKISKAYHGEEIGIEDDGTDKLVEEIYAYITGLVHAGDSNNIVRPFLRDYDAVKAAWDDLIKKQATDSLYSSQETDADNAPTFYSKMGKVIEGMKQEKFGASSVISMLRDPKRGVKAEEIRWSGIQAFLEGKKSVTKQELLGFINSSMLQIVEESRTDNKVRDEYIQAWRNFVDQDLDDSEILDGLNNLDEMESYLESLVEDEDLDRYYADYILRLAHEVANSKDLPTKWDQYKLEGGANYRELVFKMPGSDYSNTAMQTHWGEDAQGVLAHARMQDFNTFIGKMLFIEEIQSDWHNQGQKDGYRKANEKTVEQLRKESEKAYEVFYNVVEKMVYDNADWESDNTVYYAHPVVVAEMFDGDESHFERLKFTDEQKETIRAMVAEEAARKAAWETAPAATAAPDAPFKKNYHEYVLKRLLRMAAEEGYDSIGWTTAETQDERWQNNLPHKEGTGKSGFLKGYQIEYDQNIKNFLSRFGKQWDSTVGKTVLDNGTEVWSMAITDSMKDSVLKEGQEMYSEHDTDYSNRSLLANAFEGITNGSEEYKLIQEYKGHIAELNSLENKLSEFNREIRKIRFGSDGQYDAEKLRRLETEAKKIAEAINRHDRKLVSLEASAPLRRLIEQERKKEAQKTKDHVREIQQNKKVRAEQTELRHKIRKTIRDLDKILNRGNKKQNVKEDMKGFVSKALELADYLFTDHVSNDDLIRKGITVRMTPKEAALVKETEDILSKLYDNADSLTDEEFTRLDAKRKANEDKLRDLLTAQRNERLNTPVYNLFNDLVTEYASLKNSKQEAVKGAYDPKVEEFLRSYLGENADGTDSDRKTHLQNMRVADMTTEELWKLHNAYTMVLHSVRQANSLFVKGKTESIEQMAGRIMSDFSKRKAPDGKVATVIRNLSNKMGWDYEKLYYALDRIGSESFTELVMNLADAENTVMQDIMEAVAFRDEIVKKYGFNNWKVNKEIDREFMDTTGKKFKMTLGQLMSLYAYSRREGAWDHIEYGGFVFGEAALTNPKPADSYKLSKAQCEAITNTLTKEQKAYVEDMQKFLSETMGAKGNEVSMLLYGINMFGEKNYFPIHIAGQFKAQANESQAKAAAGFSSMTNAGFTHAQNPNAKAPFVLEGFNEIWADHVNEMSRYHGTVPALEDMRRVMNRSSYSEAEAESMAIKQLMENSFGKDAVEYFDNLYREANSGAIRDKLEKWPQKMLSLFRKNSVAYSLSVLIQQPTSIIRAYGMIDKRYFGFKGFGTVTSGIGKAVSDRWTKAHTNAYNEMLKYAPGVTMAKEIGGFDTHTGSSIRSYLLDTNKSFLQTAKTEKLGTGKAVMEFVDDNAIANLPNVADKIAWIEIWNACKRETVATHKDLATNSDEFMQAVGERFTEVIRATQVYDSIFAKSPMLKSKHLAVQYLVSFMNEPNTFANMAESTVRDFIRGDWRSGAKKTGALLYGAFAVSAVSAIVYAMRDDDEDETFIEKYVEAVSAKLLDNYNPLTYIPFVRDAWSVLQGYSVERADMAVIADAINALHRVVGTAMKDTDDMTEAQLAEHKAKITDANWKLVESLATFLGIPLKNVRRDILAVYNVCCTVGEDMTGRGSTWNSIADKALDGLIESIPFMKTSTKIDKLYAAIIDGDQAYIDRLKSTYVDKDGNYDNTKYESAVIKALRENDPRIHAAAQAGYEGNSTERSRIYKEIKAELGAEYANYIILAINSELSSISNKNEPEKVTGQYEVYDFVVAVSAGNAETAKAVREDIIDTYEKNGKTPAAAEKAFVSDVKSGIEEAYSYGDLSKEAAESMLVEYADIDEEDAASKIVYWDFCNEHPEYDFSESKVHGYLEFAEPAGVSLDVYEQFVNGTKGLADIKDEWGDVEVSKREQVLEVIDSLDLTWQQKDALYLAARYAESKIWDVPW